MTKSKWTEPPSKEELKAAKRKTVKDSARKRGAANMVKRRKTLAKAREELADGVPNDFFSEPQLMDAMDLVPPGEPVLEELTGSAKKGVGTTYRSEYVRIARTICELGGTDIEVARALGVSLSTMWGWQSRHEEFFRAMIVGKDLPDERVVRALYQRAVGYSYPEIKVMQVAGKLAVIPQVTHIPPDVNACKSWLRARRRDEWSEQATLNLTSEESFGNLWAAISTGQILPMIEGEVVDAEVSE